jgi:NADH-quinone oxidoreductase subunit L
MHGDLGYRGSSEFSSVFSMCMLVLAGNFLVFMLWEAVGLCSYLLIGSGTTAEWAAAAKRSSIIGDFGFLLGSS